MPVVNEKSARPMRLICPTKELDGDSVASNCFYEHDAEQAARLKEAPDHFSRYAGWNFNGRIWWAETEWACEVWRYGAPVVTVTGETIPGIMKEVSEMFGFE